MKEPTIPTDTILVATMLVLNGWFPDTAFDEATKLSDAYSHRNADKETVMEFLNDIRTLRHGHGPLL